MILADTSVWIEHFRSGSTGLGEQLAEGRILMHPFVSGELACGSLKDRALILASLDLLPAARIATHSEVLSFVAKHKLWGLGVGWIDVHLLAAAALSNCRLWTLDKRLALAAGRLGLG